MGKIFFIASLLFGTQAHAEPNIISYTYLPKGTTTIELTPDQTPMGENEFNVELLDDQDQGQIISIFNTSHRDNHHYDEGETLSFPSLNRKYKSNRDEKRWINLYANASKDRDYTLLRANPERAFSAVDNEVISVNASSEIKKNLRWHVTGSGKIKIKFPYYMKIHERKNLVEENWDGAGSYVNVIFGRLSQNIGGNSQVIISTSMIEQKSDQERKFNIESGEYEVNVFNQFLTDEGMAFSEAGINTKELRNFKKGVFILEGHVSEGIIEAKVTINTLAFIDYSIVPTP